MHGEVTCELFCGNGGEACGGTVVGQVGGDVDWLTLPLHLRGIEVGSSANRYGNSKGRRANLGGGFLRTAL